VGFFENLLLLDLELDSLGILGYFTKIWDYIVKFSEFWGYFTKFWGYVAKFSEFWGYVAIFSHFISLVNSAQLLNSRSYWSTAQYYNIL